MSAGRPTMEDLGSGQPPRAGFAGWLQNIGHAVSSWPAAYRRALATKRRRTIVLTVLVALAFTFR